MITIEQCRAARGLLGWTQQDLADACGLSKTAINNFEKGHSDIKNESLKAIRMSFESAYVEFIGLDGVRKKTEDVQTLKGEEAFSNLLDDIYETLRSEGGEILVSNVNEKITEQANPEKITQYKERISKNNITTRAICNEDNVTPLTPLEYCRFTSKTSETSNIPIIIYGKKIALQLWENSMIVVINSQEASNAERQRFEHLWNNAKKSSDENKKPAHSA